jgi:S1-C subfamily serine protease
VTGKRSCQVDKEAALEDTYHELLSDTHVVGMGMGLSSLPSRHLEVESVYPGSPGEGKLQPGDEIVAAEGTTVAEPSELLAIWHDHRGGSLHLDVQRDGVVQTVVLSLPPLRK